MHRCRLLLPITAVSLSLSVCLSHGLHWLYCTETAERIQILFGVNSLGGLRNTVLDGNPYPLQRGERQLGENMAHCGPPTSQEWLNVGTSS